MNTFLKVLLIALLVIISIKLLPVALTAVCILSGIVLGVLVAGVSTAALLFGLACVLALVLSPIWLPILAVIGLIALIRRTGGNPNRI